MYGVENREVNREINMYGGAYRWLFLESERNAETGEPSCLAVSRCFSMAYSASSAGTLFSDDYGQ
jgi:hypothetical protein